MKQILPVLVWIALTLGVRADVIEFQNGTKSEGRVLALFNQRFEFADKDGSVTHVKLGEVKRIDFDSRVAAVTMRDHTIINGKLLGLEDGVLTVGVTDGTPRHVAIAEVTDLTASMTNTEAANKPAPPPAHPKPAAASAANSRPQARGSIQPEHGKITIVDFYADWCGPCRRISPVLEKIAEENSSVVVQKVNVDKHPDLAKEYKATAIPRIIIYDKQGGEVDIVIGADEMRVRKAVEAAATS
ncbi:MAG TPA: thioredoxin family protein [Verrucomicrobiae bacterium]|nr:thioredoxin family protein [Verrucomicrobiae bacterium]